MSEFNTKLFKTCTPLIAESFHKHHLEIDLTQACVGELNTILRGDINCPIIYGVGVNIKTGEIFPATFPERGPDRELRDARNFMGSQTVRHFLCFIAIKKIYIKKRKFFATTK